MTSQTKLDPERFVQAQNEVMHAVRQELASGRKRTHWMWFVFPQLAGLGHRWAKQAPGLLKEANLRNFCRSMASTSI